MPASDSSLENHNAPLETLPADPSREPLPGMSPNLVRLPNHKPESEKSEPRNICEISAKQRKISAKFALTKD